jgi:hypothetical protein
MGYSEFFNENDQTMEKAMLATIQCRTSCLFVCCVKIVNIIIHKGTVLPVLLYGCETESLTLRKEHKLKAFDNRVLRRIFGPKRTEVTGGWRGQHNEELHNLYSSPNVVGMVKSKRMRWTGPVARMGRRGTHVCYWSESQRGKRPLGRLRRRWVDNIKADLGEIGRGVCTGLV